MNPFFILFLSQIVFSDKIAEIKQYGIDNSDSQFEKTHPNIGRVGYHGEIIGTVSRKKPELKSENFLPIDRIPRYGSNLNLNEVEKQAVLNESKLIITSTTTKGSGTYNSIDQDGYLYLDSNLLKYANGTARRLYKHFGAVGNYRGDVSDSEQAVIKKISILPHGFGYSITGLFAPPGEIVTVQISAKDLTAIGILKITIGPSLNNEEANNIWLAREFPRMPVLCNTYYLSSSLFPHKRCIGDRCETVTSINDYYQTVNNENVQNTNYIKNVDFTGADFIFYTASFLGGPIYMKPNNNKRYTVIISGAVKYPHYIKGYTTKEELEDGLKSTAPYFDLEVWQSGIIHSGPRNNVHISEYQQFYEAALYWEKASAISHQFPGGNDDRCTINMMYEPFIAAGGAVAFPSRGSTNCPEYWFSYVLDYKKYLVNGDGDVWGPHHEFNHHFQRDWAFQGDGEVSNNAVTLVTYSFISKVSQRRTEDNEPDGDGWNRYSSASFAVTKAISGHDNDLVAHSVFIHCFGQYLFIKAASLRKNRNNDRWYESLSEVSGLDLSYFFLKVYKTLKFSDNVIAAYNTSEFKKFVPIASRYQTGVGYMIKGKRNEIHTMQPFRIMRGKDKILNFTKQMIVPNDIEFTIKSVSQPQYGSIEKVSENVYVYHPDANHDKSGKITMLIGLRNKEIENFPVDDVEMYLEFMQSYELRDQFKNERILDRAIYVYNQGQVPTDPVAAFRSNYAGHIEYVDVPNNNTIQNSNSEIWYTPEQYLPDRIVELRGKTEVDRGKYRFALRGRVNVALFISLDEGKTYELACNLSNTDLSSDYKTDISNGYHDYEFPTSQWVYYKAVLVHYMPNPNDARKPFIGVGMGKFNEQGTVTISHLKNAYEQAFTRDKFTSTNPFPRVWTEKHISPYFPKGTLLKSSYIPWTAGVAEGLFFIENLFDDNDNNIIHTAKEFPVSESNPFSVTVDLGSVISSNIMTIFGSFENNYQYQPKNFKLYVGNDLNDLKLVATVTNSQRNNKNVVVEFPPTEFRYYQFNATASHASNQQYNYISYRYIAFSNTFSGTVVSLDDDRVKLYNSWKKENKFCTFGTIYVGEFNSKISFMFSGTKIGIKSYSSSEFGSFWIYIDGVKVKFIDLNSDLNQVCLVYKNENLEDKEHELTIRGFTKFNIDSFIIGNDVPSPNEEIDGVSHDFTGIEPTATPVATPVIPPKTPTASKSPTPLPIQTPTPVPVQTESPTPLPLLPVNETILTNPEGYVNITCDKFEYNGWDANGRGQICVQSGEANHGSFTRNTGATATVKFVGTRFHILAWKQENSGPANIYVDGKLIGTPNFNSNNGKRYAGIAFTSPEFAYGEHTLVIEHAGELNVQSVVFGSIYVDPVPSVGSFKDSYEQFKPTKGTWTESTSTTPATFSCSDSECEGEFDIFGTRFWLTGVRGSDVGEFEITVDDGQPILIQERKANEIAQNNLPVILYQSDELPFRSHKVKVKKTGYQIKLVNVIYTLYPNVEIPTQSPAPTRSPYPLLPPDETVLGNQEGLINITCDKFEYNGWDANGRGQICVKSGEANHGSFTRNTGATATVKFIGTKFHILAWKQENSGPANIYVDGELVGTPDFYSGNQGRFSGIAYTSPEFPYGEHTLVIEHAGQLNAQSVVLGSIYVDPLPDVGGFKLAYEDFASTKGKWTKSTSTTPSTFTCSDDECDGEFEFFGTRFWLTGVRGSDVGEFEITIDDGQPILIQERQTSEIAQNNLPVVLYQSGELEFRPHKIKIHRTNYQISLVNLLYTIYPHTETPTPYPTQTPTPIPLLPPDTSLLTNQEGYVNITCDKFEYSRWDEGGRGQICVQNDEANHGSFTRNTGATATVKFVGTRFHILAWKQENSGPANIYVDGKLIGTPNFNSYNGQRLPGIAFTSPEFPYGEHTLKIEHTGSFNTQSVVFGSIYVNPLPDVGGFKLGLNDLKLRRGTWTESTSTTPSTFTCTDDNCGGEFEFFGTRFWLTGVRGSDVGEFEITIDDGQPILIQERQTSEIAQNNLPVILYQSGELAFGLHTVTIRKTNYRISLVNLMYTLYPYTEVPTKTPIPLLPVDGTLMTNQDGYINLTCDKFEYKGWDDGGRGQICVQNNEANHGSFTRNTGATATVNFTGTKFHILAWKQENSGPANIYVDGELVGTPNFNSGNQARFSDIAYTSPEFPYGEHTLVIEHAGSFNSQSVVFGSIYVYPLSEYGSYKLSFEDFIQVQGAWSKVTDSTAPLFTCTESECTGLFNFTGTKFYLTGVRGSQTGEFEITIDDGQPILVQERKPNDIAQNNFPVILYQSDELEFKQHTIKIERTDYQITLVNLFYTTLPWLPSDIIVNNNDLVDKRYDQVVTTDQQVNIKIEVSSFNGIKYNDNGGAIHVVNAGFECEQVEFEKCKSEEAGGAIYLSNSLNYENSFILDGLTFDKCEAKYGGAVYIYSPSKSNKAVVRNCVFTNNDAYLTKTNSENGKYGGSAIFMSARNGSLENNKILNNRGDTAVKIYNHFSKTNLRTLNDNDDKASFLISNCRFEISKESLSCLYYYLGNDASSFEIKSCSFLGKLSKNAHFIDGQAINKLGPKLIVKKCKFASLEANNAFNMNSINEFLSIDLKDQIFDDSNSLRVKSKNNWRLIVAIAVPAVAVVLLICVIAVMVVRKRKNNNVVEENEMASQSYVIEESQLNSPLL